MDVLHHFGGSSHLWLTSQYFTVFDAAVERTALFTAEVQKLGWFPVLTLCPASK